MTGRKGTYPPSMPLHSSRLILTRLRTPLGPRNAPLHDSCDSLLLLSLALNSSPTSTTPTGTLPRLPLHPFHMVALSPWPVLTSASIFGMLAGAAMWFNSLTGAGLACCLGISAVVVMLVNWFKDVTVESSLLGLHTKVVAQAHVMGMGLFITTEAMFFASVFWAFFHSALSPTVELGAEWPPAGIEAVDPLMIPLKRLKRGESLPTPPEF